MRCALERCDDVGAAILLPYIDRRREPREGIDDGQHADLLAVEKSVVDEGCRKAGISEATYCGWRKKCGGLMPSEMKRLKQLQEEKLDTQLTSAWPFNSVQLVLSTFHTACTFSKSD